MHPSKPSRAESAHGYADRGLLANLRLTGTDTEKLYFVRMNTAGAKVFKKNSTVSAGIELRGRHSSGRPSLWMLILVFAFACFFSGTLSAQRSSVSPSDQQIFQKAMSALNGGNEAEAASLLKDLNARYPDNFEINESLGLLYAAEHDLPSALPLMAAAVSEQPNSDAAAANLGIAYLKSGRSEDAEHELERAATLNPRNTRVQEALGQVLMELGQPRKAAAAFHEALAADGNNPTLLYNAALADFGAGDPAGATSLLARMPGVEHSPEAQSLYGDAEEKLGAYKEAGQHYINAARLAPTEANEYVLGVEFLRHWTFEPAVAEFEAAARRFPDSHRLQLGLGIAYFGNHNYDKAIPVFAGLLADDPSNATYADLLGRTCSVPAVGNDPHCASLVSFAQQHPQDGKAATYAAINILHQPETSVELERAQQLLTAALHVAPDFPEAHYEMGLLLERQGKWQESIPELESAIRLKPDYSAAHYHLALAYRHTGQQDKAQQEIRLQQTYSAQEAKERDKRLEQIQTLLVTMK